MGGTIELGTKPFVRVEDHGIDAVDAFPELAVLGDDHRRACPGRIKMHIEAEVFRDRDDRSNIIRRANAGATGAGDDAGWPETCRKIGFDGRTQRVRIHGAMWAQNGDTHQIVLADAGDPDGPVDGGVDLVGGIDPKARLSAEAGLVAIPRKGALAHGQDGGESCGGGAVLDHSGKGPGQTDGLAQPVHHPGFHLGCRRRGLPKHALRRHGGNEIFRQH